MRRNRKIPLFLCLILILILSIGLAYALNPSTVDDTTHPWGTAMGLLRRTFYAQGRHWAFYMNGTDLCYSTSIDGEDWTEGEQSPLIGTGTYPSQVCTFDTFYDGTYIHYTIAPFNVGTDITYRRGIPQENGSITLTDNQQPYTPPGTHACSITGFAIDSEGYPWIGWCEEDSGQPTYVKVSKSDWKNGSWHTQTGFPVTLMTVAFADRGPQDQIAHMVPLTLGKIYVMYGDWQHLKKGKMWNGTDWGEEESVCSSQQYIHYCSAVSFFGSDDVHFVYLEKTTYDLTYVKRSSGVGWGDEVTIQEGTTEYSCPALSADNVNNQLFCFWQDSPYLNHLYYKKCYRDVWDTNPTDWIEDPEFTRSGGSTLACSFREYGDFISVIYERNAVSPYLVRFAYLIPAEIPAGPLVVLDDFPIMLGNYLGISTFVSRTLLSAMIMCVVALSLAMYKAKGLLIVVACLSVSGFLVAIGWLPIWLFLILSMIIAFLFANKIKGMM